MMEKDKNNSRKSNKLTDKHVAGKERRDKRKKKQRALLRWEDDNLHFATISLLKAFFFNLTIYLGVNYGSHPWHWYFSNGLPCLLGPLLLLLLKVVIVCTYISGPVKKSDPTLNLNRTFSR